ncbi:MAG TPA: esterase-like activity of phytase family protein [Glaciihabitans sp.]|jgi:hypothetical protein|nr:esterase-like activity of phytase family protein [Glaciihabitans sp.]
MRLSTPARGAAFVVGTALAVSCLAAAPAIAAPDTAGTPGFVRTATYPVFQNAPVGVDPAAETAAEISGVTDDGNTVIYTDAPGKRIGFLDITDPSNPVGTGSISLAELGHADDQPTSVAVYGDYVLVVVDESGGDFVGASGRLDVIRISDRTRITSIDLGGQPDSIAISADKQYAAIAIENQRDEEFTPDGADEGDLPQLPAGFIQIIELNDDPTSWTADAINLVNEDRSALDALVEAGLDTPIDPEPEYVTINANNQLAVTLQENNGVVVIDLTSREIINVFSAGAVTASGFDTVEDSIISLTDTITDVPREPDSIAWIDETHLATANEGDWKGGSRGWTIFDATSGDVVWDAGNSFEELAVTYGVHNNDRAEKKGPEPEGLLVSTINDVTYGFVASERSNFVAVYDLANPAEPKFLQVIFATNGPEGLLSIPSRDLLVVSSETDEADNGVRASVALFELGETVPSQPSIVSAEVDGVPIGWQALGALSAKPGDESHIYAASDAALSQSTIFSVDVSGAPAVIDDSLVVTQNGEAASFDIEGLHAREQGGFWLAAEGATGAENMLYRTDKAGAVVQSVALPTEISDHIGKWGYEGVTAVTDDADNEQLYVALQRPLFTDPADTSATVDGDGVTRIGRYDVTSGTWTWFGYQLESTDTEGDWMGLSEIVAVDSTTLAVIERDKLNGPDAAIKRVYTVEIPETDPAENELPILETTLALDVLPTLQAANGWTQEKLEGLTIGANGELYAVTDNDGLNDATGETLFLNLGSAADIFGTDNEETRTTPAPIDPPVEAPVEEEPSEEPVEEAPAEEVPAEEVPAEEAPAEESPAEETPAGQSAEPTFSINDADLKIVAGGKLPLSGAGFAPGTELTVTMFSEPVVLGTVTTSSTGTFAVNYTVPASASAGVHSIVVTGPNGLSVERSFTVVAAAPVLAKTGVDSVGLWVGSAFALLVAGAATILLRRRFTNN